MLDKDIHAGMRVIVDSDAKGKIGAEVLEDPRQRARARGWFTVKVKRDDGWTGIVSTWRLDPE